MPTITASAPGKSILFGEHAVVYGRPAIAVPVNEVRARVSISASPHGINNTIWIIAPQINLESWLHDLNECHHIRAAITGVLDFLNVGKVPSCTIRISSTIPVSAGMGSGAAVTVSLIRALSTFLGHPISDDQTCSLTYEVEKIHHKTPSGIDNSVVTYNRPIYFEKGREIEQVNVPQSFDILIGDTGIPASTAAIIGDLRTSWLEQPEQFENLFDRAGELSRQARIAIEMGDLNKLGEMMYENHALLVRMGVSSIDLDRLVEAAHKAGALGAKLSGAGRGGNVIALINENSSDDVKKALFQQGAKHVIKTRIRATIIDSKNER